MFGDVLFDCCICMRRCVFSGIAWVVGGQREDFVMSCVYVGDERSHGVAVE